MSESDSVARWDLAAGKTMRTPSPTAIEQEVIQLFDELRSGLLRYLLGFGLPSQDGEEVIQEVFLALFQHLQRGRSRENLHGWIFRVAHNLGLKRRMASAREALVISDEGLAAAMADRGENPEEQLLSSRQHKRLQMVFRALPEQDRCCLYLRAEGLRYREIAATLGISLGAVSIALTRSLARMGRVVEG